MERNGDFAPRHMYHPTQPSRIVRSAEELEALEPGWRNQAYPAPEPDPEPGSDPLDNLSYRVASVEDAVTELRERVNDLTALVGTATKKKK
jgi:hypothetical protein